MILFALGAGPALRAQDAATEERLNRLSGQIEDLKAGQESLRRQVEALAKELDAVREQAAKPTGNYASEADLQHLADAVKEVDRKRMEDAEKIHNDLLALRKSLLSTPAPPPRTHASPPAEQKTDAPVSDKGYDYVIKKGDNLSTIVQAYREKNIKVTMDQILKANPGLVPEKLQVGQKIFIPAPAS